MALPALRVLSLCAGYGGLELGVHRASGGNTRVVCYVEREASAASVLVKHMEAGRLDPAPIWSDLRSFDAQRWRGAVDIVTAGYPCQPESVAGLQRGADDERWIWPDIARGIRGCEPSIIFAENVAAHVTGTFSRVLADLAALGFDAEWSCVSAAEVGAPHERERLFWLAAHSDRVRQQGERIRWLLDGERTACGHDAVGCGDSRASQTADAYGERSDQGQGCARQERAGRAEPRGSGAWPWPPPEPAIPRVDDGPASGLAGAEIMMAGNGVVPAQAEHAFRGLFHRMMERLF